MSAIIGNSHGRGSKKGGYILLDFSGVDTQISDRQEITKEQCDAAIKSIDLNKPIYLINLTAGEDELGNVIHCTPVPVYGVRYHESEAVVFNTFESSLFDIEVVVDPETQKCYASVTAK